jgi:hypothetical protein
MADPSGYSRATLLGLVGLGQATCYWPEPPCSEPVVVLVQGRPVANMQIAHIHAARPDGPRYRTEMTDDQRRDFKNLILLCTPHHYYVDKIKPLDYPAGVLQEWKASKEKGGIAALSRISGLTEENLAAHVINAAQVATAELQQAIGQLREFSPVAADLLKAASASEMLYSASTHLSGLSGAAEMLFMAAHRLPPNLSDTAEILDRAATKLLRAEEMRGYST